MNISVKQAQLKRIFGRFEFLPEAQLAKFAEITELRSLEKGENFVRNGESSETIAIVVSGLLRAYYLDEDGKYYIRKFYKPMDVLGAFATALSQEPAHVTIDTLEESTLLTFPYSRFVSLREADLRWERVNRELLELNYVQRERRAFQLLAFDAQKRYALFCAEYGDLAAKISKTDIASYLGISPVSLSRIIHGPYD